MISSYQNKFLVFISFGNFILLLVILFFLHKNWQYIYIPEKERNNQKETQLSQGIVKDAEYQETSPDGGKELMQYEIPDNPENQYFVAVKDKASKIENYIFASESRDGFPHWLGNEYIYFTIHCGSSCEGIDL